MYHFNVDVNKKIRYKIQGYSSHFEKYSYITVTQQYTVSQSHSRIIPHPNNNIPYHTQLITYQYTSSHCHTAIYLITPSDSNILYLITQQYTSLHCHTAIYCTSSHCQTAIYLTTLSYKNIFDHTANASSHGNIPHHTVTQQFTSSHNNIPHYTALQLTTKQYTSSHCHTTSYYHTTCITMS